jgi:ankyrin repeat protein/L-ascorbate metabolism protein UlaG (beta-lactamase superfamily)
MFFPNLHKGIKMKILRLRFATFPLFALAVLAARAGEIHDLVRQGDIERIKGLIEAHPELVHAGDDRSCTPLHFAVNRGDSELVHFLLDMGADKNARDADGDTPLHWAAIYGKPGIADLLISRGADITAVNNNSESLMDYALRGGAGCAVVDRLLDAGAAAIPSARSPDALLLDAASAGCGRLLDMLVIKGADRNFVNQRGETLLHRAAMGGLKAVVCAEIDRGVKADVRMFNGQTPLAVAASAGHKEIVELLAARGADVNVKDNYDSALLECAAESGDPELVGYFLDKGLRVNGQNDWGGTALTTIAQRSGNRQAFDLLLSRGADPNLRDSSGETAFTWAAITGKADLVKACWEILSAEQRQQFGPQALNRAAGQGRSDIVTFLLEQGMDVDSRLWNGRTPLMAAAAGGMTETVNLLLGRGGNPNFGDELGRTPLHDAAVTGRVDVMSALAAGGATVNAPDNDGNPPLFLARAYRRKSAAEFLETKGGRTHKTEPDLLRERLKMGEAMVWFLGHSSWAVRTCSHFLVFDYTGRSGRGADDPGLSNGNIVPEEIAHEDVLVFTSHAHGDHFNPIIYSWKSKLPRSRYFFGWDLNAPIDVYSFGEPRAELEMADVKIHTVYDHHETVPEVAFLIGIDGIDMLFSGDYLGRVEQDLPYLKSLTKGVDIAFCGSGGRIYTTAVNELGAKVYFPMHAWPFMYEGFSYFRSGVKSACIVPALFPGDRFLYRDGKMHPFFKSAAGG